MGLCTFMKTVEVTRAKGPGGKSAESTIAVARRIFGAEGVRGMYKGVSAVALRQASNWGSRFGFSRVVEGALRGQDKERPLAKSERLAASVLGGGLAVWNHPFEGMAATSGFPLIWSWCKMSTTNIFVFACAVWL